MSELSAALVQAWGELESITKSRTARVPTKSGGEYSYDYADLGDTLDAIRPVLARHGLAALQPVETVDGRTNVSTLILHRSGEQMLFGPLILNAGDGSPQAVGSVITYARRYSLLSSLGLATEDDDAGAAQRGISQAPAKRGTRKSQQEPASSPEGDAAVAHARATNAGDKAPAHVQAIMDEFSKTKGAVVVAARHHDQAVKTVGDIGPELAATIAAEFREKAAAAAS